VRELATLVDVSVKTLRAAQTLLARDGLLEIRHGSGVYLTERAKPRWIGIYTALNVLQPRTSSFHTLALNALRQYFANHGFQAEIYIGQAAPGDREQYPSSQRFVEDVAAGRFAGVVIQSAPQTAGWDEWAGGLRVPAVGRYTPYDVEARYDEMVRRSVSHLIGQGCRRIAMLSFAPGAGEVALKNALTGCGLDYRAEWVRQDLHPMLSGAGWEEFREIWMARREKPDGLIAADDVLFDEARIAIQELGIHVPEQLRIVTHANKGAARRYPFPVTEIQLDPEQYAEALGGMLVKRLSGEAVEPPGATLPFEMVEATPVAVPVAAKTAPRIVPHEVGV
jgi:DNA-binding LacI/PurR family transcriptional regulator